MDFWAVHGFVFILFMFFLPRLTTLAGLIWGTIVSGGVLWWLGWLFCPRLLVAILGTTYYWDTNPVICVLAWFWALLGDCSEERRVTSSDRKSSARQS